MSEDEKKVLKIDNIAAGKTYEHEGFLEVLGDIGHNAKVLVKKGGLLVHGNVHNDASLTVEDSPNSHISIQINSTSGGGGLRSIFSRASSGTTIIINGKVVNGGADVLNASNNVPLGITLKGQTEHRVSLQSDRSVDIQNAGDKLDVKCQGSFDATDIGAYANIKINGSADFKTCGDHAIVITNGSLDAKQIGGHGRFEIRGSADFDICGRNTEMTIHGSLDAKNLGMDSQFRVNGSADFTASEQGVIMHTSGSLDAKTLGAKGHYTVGGSADIVTCEDGVSLRTTGSFDGRYVKEDCMLDIGASADIKEIGARSSLSAKGSIDIGTCHDGVLLKKNRRTDISKDLRTNKGGNADGQADMGKTKSKSRIKPPKPPKPPKRPFKF